VFDRTVFGLAVSLACAAGEVDGEWPRWRGPFDNGVARGEAPLKWSDTQNIAWRVQVAGSGHSSPVIWGNRIFITTAIPTGAPAPAAPQPETGRRRGFGGPSGEQPEHRLVVLCYDRRTGKQLWERTPRTVKPHEGYHPRYGSFASNSPVTDGKRVYTFFGSNGAWAWDLDGKLLWEYDPGVKMRMRGSFGEGMPSTLHGDTLLLTFDHDGDDFLVALDTATGKPKWRIERQEISNWSGPLVVEHAGVTEVITAAPTKVRSYDIKDGKLLWETSGLGANTIPVPVSAEGMVYVMSGFRDPNLLAIRLGRRGDLTGTDAIVWTTNRGTSYTPSPVLHEGKLYMLTDSGMLSCLDAATGKPYYDRTRLPGPANFKASPVAVNGRLYLSSEEGDVIVVRMGETFEVLAVNKLTDQSFVATPAVADGDLYLRSRTHLFCIREKK
jgi:outer membrane protein assembly factor BamB